MAPKIGFFYFRQFADFSFFSNQRFFLLRDKFGAKTFVLIFLAGNFFPNFRLVFPPPSGLATKISPVSTDHDEDSVFQNCNSGSIKSDAETDTRAELKNWQQRKNKMVATMASFAEVDFFTSRCTSGRPPARRRRPSWDRFCCPTPWRPCPRPSRNRECQRSVWKKLGE